MSRFSSILIFLLLPVFLAGCGYQYDSSAIMLNDKWYWSTDLTDASSFHKIDKQKELYNLQEKLPDKQGIIFLTAEIHFPKNYDFSNISFYLGRARIADRVYMNGNYIGGGGSFPPELFTAGYGARSYYINENIIRPDGPNYLVVALYIDGIGGLYSNCFIGDTYALRPIQEQENFYHSRINEIFSFFMIFIALFYFFQFLGRPQAKENLYYSLININTAFFLLPFFVSEIPAIDANLISYLAFNKIFVLITALITCLFATSYIRKFIGEPPTENVIITRFALFIVPIIVLSAIPDVNTFVRAEPFFFLFVLLQILFAIVPVVMGVIKGKVEIRSLLLTFSPVIITVVIDFVVHIILNDSSKPIFSIFGWQGTIFLNLIILSYRMNAMHRQIEQMNTTLEKEVQERTRDLIRTNQALEAQIQRNKDDMDYAMNVQKNFFPKQLPVFDQWELGYHLQPASGVSGDFFDFFISNNTLNGISLFDVSGHGLAAGLVTMLCKNIISDRFSMEKPLDQVLMDMHTAILTHKGDIENFLTGVLIKLQDDGKGELTGAGHQPPVLVHTIIREKELLLAPDNVQTYGMIGSANTDVNFAVTPFMMYPGDFLILYTDGIVEATDHHGIQYGREMLETVFSHAANDNPAASAQELADTVIRSLHRFTQSDTFEDDVTILVLKKK